MSRQAPPAQRFRLASPPTSSSQGNKNKRRSGSGSGGCKTSTLLLLVIILFVVMIAVLLPSRFLSLPTANDHPMMNLRNSQQMLYQGLHRLEALEATTEKELYKGLQMVEQVAEKGLHKLEEAAEKWANGTSTGMDGLDAGSSVDWPNHVYPVDSTKSKTSTITSISSPTIKTTITHIPPPITKSKRRRIAYAITITKDGFFQDGAAILAYSIMNISRNSPFDISLVAFVHPNVTTSRPSLQRLGYHVIEAPKPINVTAISQNFTFLRDKIDKNGTGMYGCCGASELIKLNSYRLTQYEWVVHMDADTYLLDNIHELFEKQFSLLYTTDPNMATFKKDFCAPAQGGFLVLRPSVNDYENLINIIMTTGFFKGSGWNRSHVGWFWGGMTVQGILPYYYNIVGVKDRSAKINRCIYNTMADTDECTKQSLDEIKSAHFTVCQKPWNCYKAFVNGLCHRLHKRWFELRKQAEEFYGLPVNENPCPNIGMKNYVPMAIDKAVFPDTSKVKVSFTPDESPDVLLPIGNSGIVAEANYDEYKHN